MLLCRQRVLRFVVIIAITSIIIQQTFGFHRSSLSIGNNPRFLSYKTPIKPLSPLNLDVFGLGPTEFIIIIVVASLLYGPNGFPKPFQKKQSEDEEPSKNGWEYDMYKDIEERRSQAKEVRTLRALKRYIESEDEDENDEGKIV